MDRRLQSIERGSQRGLRQSPADLVNFGRVVVIWGDCSTLSTWEAPLYLLCPTLNSALKAG